MQDLIFADTERDIVTAEQLAEFEQVLFFDRNVNMADKISPYLDAGGDDCFVVIGSGHLVGDDSVVELLQDKGYEVSPVLLN